MAQWIECHLDQEIVIARALPKLIPVDAAASALLIPQRIRQAHDFRCYPSVVPVRRRVDGTDDGPQFVFKVGVKRRETVWQVAVLPERSLLGRDRSARH